VLKIIKHCQEEGAGGSELVQGVLLGLVDKKCLEVTNCFPFPRHTEEEDFDEGISYDSCYYLVQFSEDRPYWPHTMWATTTSAQKYPPQASTISATHPLYAMYA